MTNYLRRLLRHAAASTTAAALTAAWAAPAAAQLQRNFPATALRGAIVMTEPPTITLNGEPARLAPGARIRGPDNLLQMPATLAGQRLAVNYIVDTSGLVLDVWILRPDEASRRPWPATPEQARTWSFDPTAQTWSKP